jgi:O-antigen/teichoic acid export membrane protein
VERFLVRFLIDLRSVGILEMAYKFPPMLNLFVASPFQTAWRTRSLQIAPLPDGPVVIGRMFTRFLWMMLFCALLLGVNLRTAIVCMTPSEFWSAHEIARIELLTTLVGSVNAMLVFGLVYRGRTGTVALLKILVSVLKIALSYALILQWGLQGAAYSALLIQCLLLVLMFRAAQRAYFTVFERGKVVVLLVAAALTYEFATVRALDGLAVVGIFRDRWVPGIVDLLSRSSLGLVSDGRLIEAIRARQEFLGDGIVDTSCVLLFGLLFPLVHDPTMKRLKACLARDSSV